MAFQSGITTSSNDLLDKIRLFATGSCGYTQLMYQPDGTYYRLHLQHTSGQIVNMHSYSGEIRFYGSTGWNSSAGWDSQAVASAMLSVTQISDSAEYFLFGGDGWLYCVVQSVNRYLMIAFGAIEKMCAFNGGAFLSNLTATCLRADVDGYTNNWKSDYYGYGVKAFNRSRTRSLDNYSPIGFNGVTPLYPCTVEIRRPDKFYSLVGHAPGIRLLKMAGQYVNKDVVTIGSDEYVVFALFGEGSYSDSYGYAFLKT